MARDRRKGTTQQQRFIRVVTEGKKTEPRYLNSLRAAGFRLSVDKFGVPVSDFMKWLRRSDKRPLKELGWDPKLDTLWYVCDVDGTDTAVLMELIELARKINGRIAISNPSFELWLLLHFEDAPKSTAQHLLEKKLSKLLGEKYSKMDFDTSKFAGNIDEAVTRAKRLSPNPDNVPSRPGTTVWALIEVWKVSE